MLKQKRIIDQPKAQFKSSQLLTPLSKCQTYSHCSKKYIQKNMNNEKQKQKERSLNNDFNFYQILQNVLPYCTLMQEIQKKRIDCITNIDYRKSTKQAFAEQSYKSKTQPVFNINLFISDKIYQISSQNNQKNYKQAQKLSIQVKTSLPLITSIQSKNLIIYAFIEQHSWKRQGGEQNSISLGLLTFDRTCNQFRGVIRRKIASSGEDFKKFRCNSCRPICNTIEWVDPYLLLLGFSDGHIICYPTHSLFSNLQSNSNLISPKLEKISTSPVIQIKQIYKYSKQSKSRDIYRKMCAQVNKNGQRSHQCQFICIQNSLVAVLTEGQLFIGKIIRIQRRGNNKNQATNSKAQYRYELVVLHRYVHLLATHLISIPKHPSYPNANNLTVLPNFSPERQHLCLLHSTSLCHFYINQIQINEHLCDCYQCRGKGAVSLEQCMQLRLNSRGNTVHTINNNKSKKIDNYAHSKPQPHALSKPSQYPPNTILMFQDTVLTCNLPLTLLDNSYNDITLNSQSINYDKRIENNQNENINFMGSLSLCGIEGSVRQQSRCGIGVVLQVEDSQVQVLDRQGGNESEGVFQVSGFDYYSNHNKSYVNCKTKGPPAIIRQMIDQKQSNYQDKIPQQCKTLPFPTHAVPQPKLIHHLSPTRSVLSLFPHTTLLEQQNFGKFIVCVTADGYLSMVAINEPAGDDYQIVLACRIFIPRQQPYEEKDNQNQNQRSQESLVSIRSAEYRKSKIQHLTFNRQLIQEQQYGKQQHEHQQYIGMKIIENYIIIGLNHFSYNNQWQQMQLKSLQINTENNYTIKSEHTTRMRANNSQSKPQSFVLSRNPNSTVANSTNCTQSSKSGCSCYLAKCVNNAYNIVIMSQRTIDFLQNFLQFWEHSWACICGPRSA